MSFDLFSFRGEIDVQACTVRGEPAVHVDVDPDAIDDDGTPVLSVAAVVTPDEATRLAITLIQATPSTGDIQPHVFPNVDIVGYSEPATPEENTASGRIVSSGYSRDRALAIGLALIRAAVRK